MALFALSLPMNKLNIYHKMPYGFCYENACHFLSCSNGYTRTKNLKYLQEEKACLVAGLKCGFQKRSVMKYIICQAQGGTGSAEGLAKTAEEDWWVKNDASIRAAPLVAGTTGGLLVVLNRALSGVAPVADAGSSQSRADVLCLALAATLVLTGLVWKSLQSKPPITVELNGIDCLEVNPSLPPGAAQELLWAWESLRGATRCGALVVVYGGTTALQAGKVRESQSEPGRPLAVDEVALLKGSICGTVMASGRANYIANLALFPGRFELPFFPSNTQAVIVQPLGEGGVMLLACDTVRGFGPLDQAWIATVAQKLDSTLQDWHEASRLEP